MNGKKIKQVIIYFLTICVFINFLEGCSSQKNTVEHILEGNTFGYYFDVFTTVSKDKPRNGVIELQYYDDEICFQIENAGQKRQFAVHIFVDYLQTPFIIDGTEYETFIVNSDEQVSEIYKFKLANPLDTNYNHSLLVILVAGSDILTNQIEFDMTDIYSIALNHVISFGDNLSMIQSDYQYEDTEPVTEYQSTGLLLNTDIKNNTRVIPNPELRLQKGEEFSLQYQVGGYEDCEEVAIIITAGLKQIKINNKNYLICHTQNGELVQGVANLKAPEESGEYEIMGWVITEPFDADKSEYLPLDASYRFTLYIE